MSQSLMPILSQVTTMSLLRSAMALHITYEFPTMAATTSVRQEAGGDGSRMETVYVIIFIILVVTGTIFYCHVQRRTRQRRDQRLRSPRAEMLHAAHVAGTAYGVTTPTVAIIRLDDRHGNGESIIMARPTTSIVLSSFEAPEEVGDDICAICLSPLKEEPVSQGTCSHYMHSRCLQSWLSKDAKHACPVCRIGFESQPTAQSSSQKAGNSSTT